jgi:hypothetical protein
MKKTLLSVTIMLTAAVAFSQTSIEFIPAAGYTFSEKINFNNAYGRIGDGLNFGGSFQFNFSRGFGLELMYQRMDPVAKMYNYPSNVIEAPYYTVSPGINYAMIGPVQSVGVPGAPVRLFLGPLIGAAIFTPGPDDNSSNAKFAWGLQAGTNIYFAPWIGLRLSARLLSAVEPYDGGYYFGSFGDRQGNGNGYSGGSSIYQFGFNAGLILGLGRPFPERKPKAYHRTPQPKRYYYY